MKLVVLLFFVCSYAMGQSTVCSNFEGFGDTTVCSSDITIQLNASSGYDNYSWAPAFGLSDSTTQNPLALISSPINYVVTASGYSPNLIANGDFSGGNTNFYSGHIFTNVYSPGNYFVGPNFFGYGSGINYDHTPTSDNFFMSVDGATASTTLWETALAITPNTNYKFDFWCIRAHVIQPIFEIHFIGNISGDVVMDTIPGLPYASGPWVWDEYGVPIWNSGSNTNLTIRIINLELNGGGNDFALDDMSFKEQCNVTDTVEIYTSTYPSPPITVDTIVCANNSVFFVNAVGQDLVWYEVFPGVGDSNAPTLDVNEPSNYTFYVTQNNNGCESLPSQINVQVESAPYFNFDDSYLVCDDIDFVLGPLEIDWDYFWTDSVNISPRPILFNSTYALTASNHCGEHTETTEIVFEDCQCFFYLPNSITADNSGTNDKFLPVYDCRLEDYHLLIFDRWGEIVFSSNDIFEGWNGEIPGNSAVQDGVYIWQVQFIETETNQPHTYQGHVVVLK